MGYCVSVQNGLLRDPLILAWISLSSFSPCECNNIIWPTIEYCDIVQLIRRFSNALTNYTVILFRIVIQWSWHQNRHDKRPLKTPIFLLIKWFRIVKTYSVKCEKESLIDVYLISGRNDFRENYQVIGYHITQPHKTLKLHIKSKPRVNCARMTHSCSILRCHDDSFT